MSSERRKERTTIQLIGANNKEKHLKITVETQLWVVKKSLDYLGSFE